MSLRQTVPFRLRLLSAVAILCAAGAIGLVVFALVTNSGRWNEGPVVIPLTENHGLHRMDLLLIGAAGIAGAIAWIAARSARRQAYR